MDNEFENPIETIENDFSVLENIHRSKILNSKEKDIEKKTLEYISQIYKDTIGNNYIMKSPFGYNNFLIYADYTSSGRSLNSIENFIKNKVLISYTNIYSKIGFCSEQISKLYKESKYILRDYYNAWENYSIIYEGQGCTGAIFKCIDLLNIKYYVKFYENLESLAKIHNSIFKMSKFEDDMLKKRKVQYEIMTKDLRRKIDKYYRLIFYQCNFCHKIKNNLYRCLLCKDENGNNLNFDSKGKYYLHEKSKIHINNIKEFYENPKKNLFSNKNDTREYSSFLDEIRQNYKITKKKVNWERIPYHYEEESKLNYLYDLIKDYKRFKPVIFISIYEKNSNKFSWIETNAEVVTINNLEELHSKITSEEYINRYIKIGSFTSASNITGLLIDVDAYSIEMHKNGGFVFFDYSSGAPYLQINLNEKLPDDYRKKLGFNNNFSEDDIKKYCYKDGIYFSPHKFIGGINTPGVLIIHNRITMNKCKSIQERERTLNYDLNKNKNYILDTEIKEESGTPNIIGSIRIGLLIYIKSKINHNLIIDINDEYNQLMNNINEGNLYIFENKLLKNKSHIPIFSFMISYADKFYHPNYICALLNDIFGIQTHFGSYCVPDYEQLLFKNKFKNFEEFKNCFFEGYDIFKPGYTSINLPFFYPKFVIEYIIKAIKFICNNANLFLGLYNYDIKSGKFFIYNKNKFSEITKISTIKFENEVKDEEFNILKSSYLDKDYPNYRYTESEISDKNKEKIISRNSGKVKEISEKINNEIIEVPEKIITRRKEEEKKDNEIDSEISKEKLDKIFIRIEDYCSNLLFDNLKEAQLEIQTDIRKYEFGSYDKFRWFLLYKDIRWSLLNKDIKDKFKI